MEILTSSKCTFLHGQYLQPWSRTVYTFSGVYVRVDIELFAISLLFETSNDGGSVGVVCLNTT
jgi:hypothetical protein